MNSLTTSASPFSAAYQSFLRFSSCGDDASEGRCEERRASRTVSSSEGETFSFEVDPFKKHCLLEGLDDIGLSLEKAPAIDSYEAKMAQERPWV